MRISVSHHPCPSDDISAQSSNKAGKTQGQRLINIEPWPKGLF